LLKLAAFQLFLLIFLLLFCFHTFSMGIFLHSNLWTPTNYLRTTYWSELHTFIDTNKWIKVSILTFAFSIVIVGEIANFAAYAFAPAILVTPLGALSIIIRYGNFNLHIYSWLFVNSDLWWCAAVLLLPILSYGRDYIYLEFLVALCVSWGLQQLFYMLLKNGKLNQCQKYGILLWIQVAMFQPWNVSLLKISHCNRTTNQKTQSYFCSFSILCRIGYNSYLYSSLPLHSSIWPDTHNGLYRCLFPCRLPIGMSHHLVIDE